jgi:hypothetical protein
MQHPRLVPQEVHEGITGVDQRVVVFADFSFPRAVITIVSIPRPPIDYISPHASSFADVVRERIEPTYE